MFSNLAQPYRFLNGFLNELRDSGVISAMSWRAFIIRAFVERPDCLGERLWTLPVYGGVLWSLYVVSSR